VAAIVRLQHVSITIPQDAADSARAFYGGSLGLEERDVLPSLDPAGFIWYRAGGDLELHLMLSDEQAGGQRHFCLVVDDLDAVRGRLEAQGHETSDATPLVGRPRFFCRDPFGNLLEFTHFE
jgi:catechol 2,3-dioxygenase-like lactoylglutathione lyase family enzyme